jgi:hypothetical protein
LYLAGLNSTTIKLPDIATEAKPSEEAIDQLKACAKVMMMGVPGKELEVLREGLVRHQKNLLGYSANAHDSASVQSPRAAARSCQEYQTRSSVG